MFQPKRLFGLLVVCLGIVLFLTVAHPTIAAPRTPTSTLIVNTNNDGNVRDSYLTLREAILIARNELWQCLRDAERAQMWDVTWDSSSTPDCNNISWVDSAWIIFATGTTFVSPTSELPGVPCNTWISSNFSTNRATTIDGTSAASANGLRFDCSTAPSGISIKYLTIQNFNGNGIRADGIQSAWLTGLAIHNNTGHGVYLRYSGTLNPRGNYIGNTPTTDRNFIYANGGDGIHVEGTYTLDTNPLNNVIQNNYVGLDTSGGSAGNSEHGINLVNAWWNTIGGNAANQGNVVSNNTHDGVSLNGTDTRWNSVYNNIIGLNPAATAKMGNGQSGVSVFGGASSNYIGNPTMGNIISGNGGGVYIADSGTNNIQVMSNAIGTNWSSASGLGNTSQGVGLYGGTTDNFVGSNTAGAGNTIGGNGGPGVDIAGSGTMTNSVYSNKIGANSTGTGALANSIGVRIYDGATNNNIGWYTTGYRNLISGNTGPGVGIYNTGTTGNSVINNYIGTNISGTLVIPNVMQGVVIQEGASSNTVAYNLISGNVQDGVNLNGSGTTGNIVDGNTIGTNANQTSALPNNWAGIAVKDNANSNTIGKSDGAAQLISGNAREGIYLSNVSNTLIGPDNDIGVAWNRTSPLGNGMTGITLDGSTNTNIQAATVAYNGGAGVAIMQNSAVNNRVWVTTLKNNGGLPIDLGNDGFTPNGAHTPPGPNNWLNYPVITSHSASTITGSACANCTVLVYLAIGNPTAPGGGGTLQTSVTANSSGVWTYSIPSGKQYSDFSFVTCQGACSASGANTSEMSPRLFQATLPLVMKNYSPPLIPAAPGPLTVTVLSTTTLKVAWNDNSTNEDGFRLEQSRNGGAFTPLSPITDALTTGVVITTITGLSPTTNYAYRVYAYNGGGNSAYSNTASGTTASNLTIPAAPSGLSAAGVYPDWIRLDWTNNANNADSIGFDLSTDHGVTWWTSTHSGNVYGQMPGDSISAIDDQRTANTEYCYRIRAQNVGGNSAWTTPMACAWTPALPSLSAPSNLTVTVVGGTTVRLTWQDNSTNEDGFEIQTSYDNGGYNNYYTPITATQNITMYTITDANVGHNYKFKVRAWSWYTPINYSSFSNEANVTIPLDTSTGAVFINDTSYSVVSLIVDGTERLAQNPSGAIPPGNGVKLTLGSGTHSYSAITGVWSAGPYRNDLWHYPAGSNTFNVTAGSVTQIPAFTNPTIAQLLSDPEGQGRSHTVWMAQTGTPYVNMCFDFRSDGTYQFRGVSGNWGAVSNYWLVSYPGNYYVTFQPNAFPLGTLSETSIRQYFPNPFFDMTQGGTTYRYFYTATNTCY